jgi:hypothetical protein
MRHTVLTRLREAERRPLAAALACLLLVAALIGGVHAGAMAADGNGALAFVLCSHDADRSGRQPADQHADPCCMAGCLAHAPALAAPPPPLPQPGFANGIALAGLSIVTIPGRDELHTYNPRGPPSLA